MVLRLLAFTAEAWLEEHLNAYLTDPNGLWGVGGRTDPGFILARSRP